MVMLRGEERGEVFYADIVSSSRITVPKIIRRKLGISEGDEVRVRIWKQDEELPKVGTKQRFKRK